MIFSFGYINFQINVGNAKIFTYRNLKINTKYNVYIFCDFKIVVLYATMLNTNNVGFFSIYGF